MKSSEIDSIIEVKMWRTSDGEEFNSYESAKYHAECMDKSFAGNQILESGGSLADALKACGYESGNIPSIFERLTERSALVIEHWQCRDSAGYKVMKILSNMKVRVYGDAGSWSGGYGSDMSLQDLARYATHPGSIFEGVCKACGGCGVGHEKALWRGRLKCSSCNGSGKQKEGAV